MAYICVNFNGLIVKNIEYGKKRLFVLIYRIPFNYEFHLSRGRITVYPVVVSVTAERHIIWKIVIWKARGAQQSNNAGYPKHQDIRKLSVQ